MIDVPGGCLALAVVLAVAAGLGYRFRDRQEATNHPGLWLFAALTSLMLAVMLSQVLMDHRNRLRLVHEEADMLGEAYRMSTLLEADERRWMRSHLLAFIDSKLRDGGQGQSTGRPALLMQMWEHLSSLPGTPEVFANRSAVNRVVQLHFQRLYIMREQLPLPLWWVVLPALMVLTAALGAACPGGRVRVAATLTATVLLVSGLVAVIADLDDPSRGFITIDHSNLVFLRNEMAQDPG